MIHKKNIFSEHISLPQKVKFFRHSEKSRPEIFEHGDPEQRPAGRELPESR